MEIVVRRRKSPYPKEWGTVGTMSILNRGKKVMELDTLEPSDSNLVPTGSTGEINWHDRSQYTRTRYEIPYGVASAIRIIVPSTGDISGRVGLSIHKGWILDHTAGCLLVGKGYSIKSASFFPLRLEGSSEGEKMVYTYFKHHMRTGWCIKYV